MSTEDLQNLLNAYVTGTLDTEGRKRLLEVLQNPDLSHQAGEVLRQEWESGIYDEEEGIEVYQRLQAYIGERTQNTGGARVVAVTRLRRRWYWAAAAVLIVAAAVTYLSVRQRSEHIPAAQLVDNTTREIVPGRDGAVLTLADGRQIVLDSMGNGVVASEQGARIILENGQLSYATDGSAPNAVAYNTMTTPRGRQFQLTLPDGTRVWLNAASSITFPAAFVGKQRNVRIEGEVYFEVATNSQQPFIVDINGRSSVQVLGTSFNINSYDNEDVIRTTLVEGSIKLSGKSEHVLRPAQQAIVSSDASVTVLSNADIGKALAWKNGLFNFEGLGLREVMRQLERWYDIRVEYVGKIPDVKFQGEMDKGVSLSGMLSILTSSEFQIEAKLKERVLVIYGK